MLVISNNTSGSTWKIAVSRDIFQYIYTDAAHKNLLCMFIPLDLISEELDYDKEKYRELLLEVSESILGYFGSDWTIYGDAIKKKSGK